MRSLLFLFSLLFLLPHPCPAQEVQLVVGSWRTEDVEQMTALLNRFNAAHPGLHAVYDPTPGPEYDEALRTQLQEGRGPDIMLLRSYCVSRRLYLDGYLETLNDLPGLTGNFTAEALAPWSDAPAVYGVPFIATSHAVYYNKSIFRRMGLSEPTTWHELLSTARVLRTAGILPFANSSGDAWTLNELVLCSIAPNFLGGVAGRHAYLSGQRCFNDAAMVALFQAVADLRPFLPSNHACLGYTDSRQIFSQGQAAMLRMPFSGVLISWLMRARKMLLAAVADSAWSVAA